MRLNYDQPTINAAQAEAEAFGHRFKGRFTRVRSGLSWESHCILCHAYVLVFPQWAPWHPGTFDGPAVKDFCTYPLHQPVPAPRFARDHRY